MLNTKVKKITKVSEKSNLIIIGTKDLELDQYFENNAEKEYVDKQIKAEQSLITINQFSNQVFVIIYDKSKPESYQAEEIRQLTNKTYESIIKQKLEFVTITDTDDEEKNLEACLESLLLSDYRFLKYFNKKNTGKKKSPLKEILVCCAKEKDVDTEKIKITAEAVYYARNLINEPLAYLTAQQFAKEMEKMAEKAGFSIKVFDKNKIESLKMGGLLAVNKGSSLPPTFTVMEWKPENAKNKKPVVLIGKGIVYDTGGLSLKPTKDSMDYMKSDMSGGAAVAGIMYAAAKLSVPVHIIGLVPSTDNHINNEAYVPGDIITMHNGMSVEILNTDAEGRLLLADALSYASKYDPELVFDIATLTGAAARAIGKHASVVMGNANKKVFKALKKSGEETFERLVRFPLWNEYGNDIKSSVADLKNVGGIEAGAITAGKFLEHFTSYPWVHFDIAGTAYFKTNNSYKGKGGTGTGVRLITEFLNRYYK